jgi:NADPH:quinone reductase-like Zn-dependent oxidoreductase
MKPLHGRYNPACSTVRGIPACGWEWIRVTRRSFFATLERGQALLLGRLLSTLGRKKMTFFIAKMNQRDLVFLNSLLQAGKIVPVIDRRYRLGDAADALRYLAEGHAQGNVVLTVPH